MRSKGRRRASFLIAIAMIAQICLIALPVNVKAETTSIFTDYLPEITQVTDDAGFIHPGVGLTKELLDNVRAKVRAGAQPWTYYFNSMLLTSGDASKTVTSSNSSDGKTPSANYFDSQGIEARFIADGIKAYTQAFMYFMTGDEVYRANALMIIRIWEQMDPAKYKIYQDSYIHAAVPLNRMVMAAEILRYTSTQTEALAWTDQDTDKFTNNLINPVIEYLGLHDPNHFMNQHNYPVLGAMSGYIFTGNRERYNESVEWFTVNRTATDQGFNGSVKALFRLVTEEETPGTKVGEGTPIAEPHVQQMEMGRDQAHGGGDLTNAAMITRLIHAQGTKVDPVAGTPSTADNAVDVMEFLDNRILGAADYFWHFMLGYDTVWTPQAYAITGGDPDNVGMGGYIRDTYNYLSPGYKGRFATANFWDFYSYYTYVKHEDVSKLAPYYYEAFTKKLQPTAGGWHNTDAGNDFWLYLPPDAEADADKFIPQDKSTDTIYEVESRYTNLTKLDLTKPAVKDNDNKNAIKDTNNIDTTAVSTMTEGDTSFVRLNARETGTKIVVLSSMLGNGTYGLRIRTNGIAQLKFLGQSVSLPDTNGEWKYVVFNGTPDNFAEITVTGAAGVTVDIDHINSAASTELTPPVFNAGSSDLKIYTYVGASVNVDFSAADSGGTDVITYELHHNPAGTSIDASTGAFNWQPAEGGDYSFFVTAADGTTIASRSVNVIVGSDRAAAVQAITASYDANEIYEKASLANYLAVYNDTMNQVGTANDADFDKLLQALRAATEGLKLMTPLTSNGSMRWSSVAVSSSWGSDAQYMDDVNVDTGGWYGEALGTPPHLYHIIDFGPDYKISATKIGFLSNIFADRVANSTVYGSNDKTNWTRITPGVAAYTQAYNTIDVDPAYQNEKYRYIKLEMVQPLPDVLYGIVRNFLELREFNIYGTRYDIDNKVKTVSMSSDQAVLGKISLGATVKVSITAKEAIKNVKVNIQGVAATVSTSDNINWTAAAVISGNVPTGPVSLTVDYQRQDGTIGDTVYGTTDGSKLFLVDGSKFINVPMLATVTASDKQWPGNGLSADQVGYLLFDGNTSTFGDLNTASGSYYTVDFGADAAVKLDEVVLMPRASVPARMNGMVVQGSNDNVNWTTITKPVSDSQANIWYDMKDDQIVDHSAYRYLRLYNGSAWSGNAAEVEFYGDYTGSAATIASKITGIPEPAKGATSIAMPKLPAGYTVSVKSSSPSGIIGSDGTITPPDYDTVVNVVLTVTKLADGTTADTGSIATVVSGKVSYPKIDVKSFAKVTASDKQWPGTGLSADQVGYLLFDGDPATAGDLNSGSGTYYIVDFGAGNSLKLNEIKLLPRAGANATRMNGLVVLGSNDGTTWTNLTQPVIGATDGIWTDLKIDKILDHSYYRYLKLFNSNAWFGNVAEVEFYGDFNFDLDSKVVAPDGYTKASYYLYQKEVDRIRTAMSQPGADKTALLGELLQAQGKLVSVSSLYPKIAITSSMAMASSISWDGRLDAATNGWRAFDGDTSTSPDTKTAAGWAQADLGAGNAKVLGSIRFMPRTGNAARSNGALIQGSNDGVNFDTLYTINGVSDIKWYTQAINSSKAYRYLRYYTPNGFANIGDLEFYEKTADRTLLTLFLDQADAVIADRYTEDSYAALQTAVTNAKSVAADAGAVQSSVDSAADSLQTALNGLIYKIAASMDPAAPNGANGWYTVPVTVTLSTYGSAEFKVGDEDSWHAYTTPITLNEDGAYTVSYRSKNSAGITGAVQTAAVNIDKIAPTVTISGLVYGTAYQDSTDITPTITLSDNLSGVDTGKSTVTLDGNAVKQGVKIPLFTLPLGSHTLLVTASDLAGNASSQTIVFKTTASIQSMQALVTRFETAGWIDGEYVWIDNQGIAESLQSKLAANELDDFINEVSALKGKHITEKAADYLLRDAQYLLAMK